MNNKIFFFLLILLCLINVSCISSKKIINDDIAANKIFLTESRNQKTEKRNIVINPANISKFNNGIFEGWGTSLCWWGNRIGNNDIVSQKVVDLLFSENGLGLNIVRYNIGGGDNPSHNHITRSDSNMPGFLVFDSETNSYVYDWSADSRQLNVFSKIINANRNLIVEVFSNSPPYFMTESGCSSGSVSGKENNLKPSEYRAFAEYLVNVTDFLEKKYNIKVDSIEPMNEANSPTWFANSIKQEGCRFTSGKAQSDMFVLLSEELEKKGITEIRISGSDETATNVQLKSFNQYSDECKKVLKKINTHTYNNFLSTQLRKKVEKTDYDFWVSETDYPYCAGKNNGEMGPALAFGKKIIKDFNELKPSAWIIWQAVAAYFDENVGSQDFNLDEGFWGFCFADLISNDVLLTKKYYAFAHFTKFIKPGSKIITDISNNCLAAIDESESKLYLIMINDTDKSLIEETDLSCLNRGLSLDSMYRTSGLKVNQGENLEKININNFITEKNGNKIKINLLPNSINTICLNLK